MLQTLKLAIHGANILPTILFVLVLLYWITMILGVVDLDLFDFDADVDANVDGCPDGGPDADAGIFHSMLVFLNIDAIPFMVVMSILVFLFWTMAMLINILPIAKGGLIAAALFIPAFMFSATLTKGITHPMRRLFLALKDDGDRGVETEGQVCTLLFALDGDRLGQAEFTSKDKHLVINVKGYQGKTFEKGERALVLEKDPGGNFYFIDKFDEWE